MPTRAGWARPCLDLRWARLCLLLTLVIAGAGVAPAATITVINLDPPGVGFNDPTPAAPVGGNPGTTIGEQRLVAVQRAADIWGGILPSDVPIRVDATWSALPCDPTFGFIAFGAPMAVEADFAGAVVPSTWYPVALANKLAKADLDPDHDDIQVQFNDQLGTAECLTNFSWYLGLDNAASSPEFDLVTTALHELAHGLGSIGFVSVVTGSPLEGQFDIWSRFLFDNTVNKSWLDMTDGERAASAINNWGLVWAGPRVTAAAPGFLGPRPVLSVVTPPPIAGTYKVGMAIFGPPLTLDGVAGEVVLANDAFDMASDACQPLVNAAQVAGKIALIDRGGCTFLAKVRAAEAAGAIGVIIANHTAGVGVITMGGLETVAIPAVMVSFEDGAAIKSQLFDGVSANMHLDPDHMAGADDAGRVLLYAPNPIQDSSSVSHWDFSATPDLLMEADIHDLIPQTGDLTVAQFRDIGWFGPDAVTLQDLSAASTGAGIVLAWQLSAEALRELHGIVVQRAAASQGPYANVSPGPLTPARAMSQLDIEVREGTAYWYRLLLLRRSGASEVSRPIQVLYTAAPLQTALMTPFESAEGVDLRYSLASNATPVQIQIYSVAGKRIRSLELGTPGRGVHRTTWDRLDAGGNRVVPGVYLLQLCAGAAKPTKKMVLVR